MKVFSMRRGAGRKDRNRPAPRQAAADRCGCIVGRRWLKSSDQDWIVRPRRRDQVDCLHRPNRIFAKARRRRNVNRLQGANPLGLARTWKRTELDRPQRAFPANTDVFHAPCLNRCERPCEAAWRRDGSPASSSPSERYDRATSASGRPRGSSSTAPRPRPR